MSVSAEVPGAAAPITASAEMSEAMSAKAPVLLAGLRYPSQIDTSWHGSYMSLQNSTINLKLKSIRITVRTVLIIIDIHLIVQLSLLSENSSHTYCMMIYLFNSQIKVCTLKNINC